MSDEPTLLQFQRELMDRLSSARAQGGAVGYLGFESANQPLLLQLSDVRAIVMATEFARIPLSDPSFRGLINFQGELVGVLDPARLVKPIAGNGESSERSGVIVLHRKFGLNAGLLAGRLVGLRDGQKWTRASLSGAPPWVASELVDEQGVRWRVLELTLFLEALRARELVPVA